MKKLLPAFFILAAFLSGCSPDGVREADELELISTIGIDKSADGTVTVTASSAPGSEGDARIYKRSGVSLSQAVDELENLPMGKAALFSHVENIVIGEDAAGAGIDEYLDYVERSVELRLDTAMFISEGTAEELITAGSQSGGDISRELTFIKDNVRYLGVGCCFTCREAANSLSDSGACLVQGIRLSSPEGEKPELFPSGMAVISNGRLVAVLDEKASRGAMIIMGKTEDAYITLAMPECRLSLKVTSVSAEFDPDIYDEQFSGGKITISAAADVTGVSGDMSLSEDKTRVLAETLLSRALTEEAEAALMAAREFGTDYLRLWRMAELSCPRIFRPLRDTWGDDFTDYTFTVEAESVLRRTYDTGDPVSTGGGWRTVYDK